MAGDVSPLSVATRVAITGPDFNNSWCFVGQVGRILNVNTGATPERCEVGIWMPDPPPDDLTPFGVPDGEVYHRTWFDPQHVAPFIPPPMNDPEALEKWLQST